MTQNRHGLTYFETKGFCIYCGVSDTNLADEHILPLALGGVHIIRNASCNACADITSRFEREVARGLWGDARTAFNAPTRRRKQRKDMIHTRIAQHSKELTVPAEEYPAGFIFYKMKPPGILQGLREDEDVSGSWEPIMIDDDERRENFFRKYGSYPTLQFKHVPQDFGRLLAKIGFGHILTVLELSEFNPICLPYILGGKQNVSYVVGGGSADVDPIPDLGYSLSAKSFVISENRLLLIAVIRLYANTHAPEYEVVVGDVVGFDNIRRVIEKVT